MVLWACWCWTRTWTCASRRILEKEGVKAYASIGIRSGCLEEFTFAKENGISYNTSHEVKEKGIDYVLDRAIEGLNSERLYLSIDLDALDPAFAPEMNEMCSSHIHPIIFLISSSGVLISLISYLSTRILSISALIQPGTIGPR